MADVRCGTWHKAAGRQDPLPFAAGEYSLSSESLSPGIPRQHVTGGGSEWRLEFQTRATEQAAISKRADQIRPGGPAGPLRIAEIQEGMCIVKRRVRRPGEVTGDLRIARVALEYARGIFT